MKSFILSGLAVVLLSIAANANDNEIVLEASVTPGAVVGFSDMSGESLGTGTTSIVVFRNPTDTFYFPTISAGEQFAAMTKPIYVKTNNGAGVTITLDDSANGGNLVRTGGATIEVDYTLLGASYTIGSTVNLTDDVDDGDTSIGDLVIAPKQTDDIQRAGTYGTTLTVTIALR
ncbi:MAG: hypothetical protein GXO30_08400 [Epsilonproteobacteria bacterium]|nr:hypothetical protein [Campylobacterota bacterium]